MFLGFFGKRFGHFLLHLLSLAGVVFGLLDDSLLLRCNLIEFISQLFQLLHIFGQFRSTLIRRGRGCIGLQLFGDLREAADDFALIQDCVVFFPFKEITFRVFARFLCLIQ